MAGSNMDPGTPYRAFRVSGDTMGEPKKAKKEALFRVGEWQDKPNLENQFKRYPHTTRLEAPKVSCFNLPEQENALNDLLAKSYPPGAPQIRIVDRQKNFNPTTGGYSFIVEYIPISYQKIIDIPKEGDDAEPPTPATSDAN